jgi:ABC-2 type transport system ATP-binding protein
VSRGAGVGFDNVTFRYGGSDAPALKGVSFEISSPRTFLLGENGSGKTTTFKLLMGALKPSEGSVLGGSPEKRWIGYCPQDFGLPGHLRASEYLAYLAWLKGVAAPDVAATVQSSLAAVGIEPADRTRLRSLSGGFKRRVGIAAALLGNPQLVLLDEPTAGLDPGGRVQIRQAIAKLAEHATLVISTHLIEDIPPAATATDILVLVKGRLAYFGGAAELDRQAPVIAEASARESSLLRIMSAGHDAVG